MIMPGDDPAKDRYCYINAAEIFCTAKNQSVKNDKKISLYHKYYNL